MASIVRDLGRPWGHAAVVGGYIIGFNAISSNYNNNNNQQLDENIGMGLKIFGKPYKGSGTK